MEIERHVAENVRRMRLQKGLSQEELAHEAEVTRSYMGEIERGERSATLRVLAKIARVLGTTVAELVTERDEPMPPNLPRGRRK